MTNDQSPLTNPERDAVAMIVHTSVHDAQQVVRSMTPSASSLRILRAAKEEEISRGAQQRHTILALVTNAAKRFERQLPKDPAAHPLDAIARALDVHRAGIAEAEHAFLHHTLPNRLAIGLLCIKAYHIFAVPDPGKRSRGANQHRRAAQDQPSFSTWLRETSPWLKESTAYKYMRAATGLGLTKDSAEADLAPLLHAARTENPDLTLADLCAAALGAPEPQPPAPLLLAQQEFQFMRDALSGLRSHAEQVLAIRETLRQHPDYERVAIARAYSLLHDLTGHDWAPTDDTPDIAHIDPDTIEI